MIGPAKPATGGTTMLDFIWVIPALFVIGIIATAYLVGIEVGRDREAREAARRRHPANRTYGREG